jgi:hypothetical protein
MRSQPCACLGRVCCGYIERQVVEFEHEEIAKAIFMDVMLESYDVSHACTWCGMLLTAF